MKSSNLLADADITGEFEAVTEAELLPELNEIDGQDESRARLQPAAVLSDLLSRSEQDAAALTARVQKALSASVQAEATLTGLLRTAKLLAATVGAVRQDNRELQAELELLSQAFEGEQARELTLERRLRNLEDEAAETRCQAERDREFLLSQHDAFLSALLSDHEREVSALRERLAEFERVAAGPEEHDPDSSGSESPFPQFRSDSQPEEAQRDSGVEFSA